jgi:hypothetical protein
LLPLPNGIHLAAADVTEEGWDGSLHQCTSRRNAVFEPKPRIKEPVRRSESLYAAIGQVLLGRAHDQRIELLALQIDGWSHRPCALVQATCRHPDADAIVRKDLDAVWTFVGEKVGVVGMGSSEDRKHPGECRICGGAYVHQGGGTARPHQSGSCPSHLSYFRSQAAQHNDASMGQLTVITPVPRRISTRRSAVTPMRGVGESSLGYRSYRQIAVALMCKC